jgi:SAM-dependent methyltransferase
MGPNHSVSRFYRSTLRKLVRTRRLDPAAKTLVVCGGELDRDMLVNFGFTDVTISNLDTRMTGFPPYEWAHQDAEALTYRDGAFAQVIEHNGLHHCASPHRALTEMYRVASRVVVAFEPRDSMALRLARRLGLTGIMRSTR